MKCLNCFKEYAEGYEICPHCGYVIAEYKAQPYYLLPGTILDGRYMLGVVTGAGGFGIVYKAWDMKLERIVAIKEFYPSGLVNRVPGNKDVLMVSGKNKKIFEMSKERFLCEARNTVKFAAHKNIINVYEYFEENNTAYIVMDLLQGIALNKYIKLYERVNLENTVFIIGNVCEALKYLHSEKVIHRDISPDNVFICEDGSIILFDFGTAEFSDDNVKVMDIVIKAGYSPIEQYDAINNQGPWTDIYALGATMYVMLTGVRPPEASNRKINDELVAPIMIDPTIPENISNAVMKAMAVEKHMRFTNVEEFQKAIKGEKKVVSLEVERKKRKRKRGFAIGVALLGVAAGVGIFLAGLNKQKRSVTLDSADLTIWVAGEEDSSQYSAMEHIVDNFNEAYPKVNIELVAVPEEEYSERVMEESRKGELPNIFYSSGIDVGVLKGVVDIGDVLESDEAKNCYFMSDYEDVYEEYYKVPLGVNLPTAYYITSGSGSVECDIETVEKESQLGNEYAVNTTYKSIIEKSFDERLFAKGTYEEFFQCEVPVLVSSTKDYFHIRSQLPTRKVKMVAIDTDEVYCQYDNEWSVGSGNKAEEKASKRFVEYMLSDSVQDILYLGVEEKTGVIPLNKNVFKTYTTETYGVHMDEFYDLVDKYSVKEGQSYE